MSTLNALTLRNALRASLLAASTDANRPHLQCVAVEADGSELHVVGTDGHRCHLVQVHYQGPPFPLVQLEPRSVKAALKLLPTTRKGAHQATLQWDGECVVVVGGTNPVLLRSLRNVAPFPPYLKVIPPAPRWTTPYAGIGLNPAYLADACTAARYLGTNGCRLYGTGDSELDPVIIHSVDPGEGVEFTGVVMPMRI